MVNSLFIFFFSIGVHAQNFPVGCPTEKNFSQICEEFAKIPMDKKLVFQDSSEMPSCLLFTESNEKSGIVKERKILQAELNPFIISSLQGRAQLYQVLNDLEKYKPEIEKKLSPDLLAKYNRLIEVEKQHVKTLVKFDAKNLDMASMGNSIKTDITDFIQNLTGKSLEADKIIEKLKPIKTIRKYPTSKEACSPSVSAEYSDGKDIKDTVSVDGSLSLFSQNHLNYVLAHEMAHSFDPCRWRKNPKVDSQKDVHPFENLISCLAHDVGKFKSVRPINETQDWCAGESHLNEAFSDFIAVEISAQRIKKDTPQISKTAKEKSDQVVMMPKGYENIFFILDKSCSESQNPKNEIVTHPTSKQRLFSIFLKNPIIAKSLGCPVDEKSPRCDARLGTIVNGKPVVKTQTNSSDVNNSQKVRQ